MAKRRVLRAALDKLKENEAMLEAGTRNDHDGLLTLSKVLVALLQVDSE